MKKIELEVIALSHSITHSHSYAVVLGEVKGTRRLPIVIGSFEAQSIAIALEKMNSARPLTHDLMKNMANAFGIKMKEVIINNLSDGIFYSQLICKNGSDSLEIDSRTSDALALALRFECPIYTYEFILDSAGIVFEEGEEDEFEEAMGKGAVQDVIAESAASPTSEEEKDISKLSLKKLDEMLKNALAKEDYEIAIKLRDEIDKRKKGS